MGSITSDGRLFVWFPSMPNNLPLAPLQRDDAREVRRQEMGPRVVPESKPYTFKYASPEKDFNIEVKFKASQVSDAEVALILRAVADEIDEEPQTITD